MLISKRGHATIAMKAQNLPSTKNVANAHKSPRTTKNVNADAHLSNGVSTHFVFSDSKSHGGNITKTEYSRYATSDAVSGITRLDNDNDMNNQYYVFSSKLVKFRDTKLRAIKFT